jgi:hypothetical protein
MKKQIKITLSLALALIMALGVITLYGCGGTPKYVFEVDDETLWPGQSLDKVEDILDDLREGKVKESVYCPGGDEESIAYTYPCDGFDVVTQPGGKGQVIGEIRITSEDVETPEGLTIGSSRDDVIDEMGEGKKKGSSLIYTDGNVELKFTFRNDRVIKLSYHLVED